MILRKQPLRKQHINYIQSLHFKSNTHSLEANSNCKKANIRVEKENCIRSKYTLHRNYSKTSGNKLEIELH